MRRIILGVLFLSALTTIGVHAETLVLSRADMVMKITDPARQLKAFTPVLDMLDGMAAYEKSVKGVSPGSKLRKEWGQFAKIPGVDARGDFWIVLMPPPATTKAAASPDTANGAKGAIPIHFPRYTLVPLADKAAFAQYLRNGQLSGAVSGNYGIVTDTPSNPPYRDIKFDVTLHSKREISIALLHGGDAMSLANKTFPALDIIPLGDNPLRNVDVRQVDVGLAMVGEDLSLEYYLVPTKGGVLEKGLRRAGENEMAMEYAGYLPAKLAYCSASGVMLDGAPGITRIVFGLANAFLTTVFPPEVSEKFDNSVKTLMNQCSNGRAVGLTVSPKDPKKSPTLVAVYHIVSAPEAEAAVHDFITQVQQVRKTVREGVLAPLFTVELKPAAETIAGTPVDVVNITVNFHPEARGKASPDAAGTTLHYTCRVAYLKDTMLFTVGEDSPAQMTAVLERINKHTAGFTASTQYQSLKASLPARTYSFTSFATHDLASALVKLVALDKDKIAGLQLLSVLPAQHTVVLTYQEVQTGVLRGELRLPAEQLNFCYTLLKAMTVQLTNTPAEEAP